MRLGNSTCPAASAPCSWNTCFAMSKPIVVACSMDASFGGSSTPSPWHTDAVGGRPPHHPSLPFAHLWTPPFRQGKTLGSLLRVVGCCHLSGLRCGRKTAAGLYGRSRTGSRSTEACSKHSGKPWLSQPRLAHCCAILSFRSPPPPRDHGQSTPPRPDFCRCHL